MDHELVQLLVGVLWMVGLAALWHVKVNFMNFIAIPTTHILHTSETAPPGLA